MRLKRKSPLKLFQGKTVYKANNLLVTSIFLIYLDFISCLPYTTFLFTRVVGTFISENVSLGH